MNIKDVDEKDINVPEEPCMFLPGMIAEQKDLLLKYKEIEGIPDWPMPFQDKQSQVWFKSFLWRTTEEISEAMEALHYIDVTDKAKLIHQHISHFFEEISDAIHFMLDVMIAADVPIAFESSEDALLLAYREEEGATPDCASLGFAFFCLPDTMLFDKDGELNLELPKLSRKILDLEIEKTWDMCSWIQYQLGLCGNVLKNKTWKQTAVISDQRVFNSKIQLVFQWIFKMLIRCGFHPNDIFSLYVSKKLVNQWRQDTKY